MPKNYERTSEMSSWMRAPNNVPRNALANHRGLKKRIKSDLFKRGKDGMVRFRKSEASSRGVDLGKTRRREDNQFLDLVWYTSHCLISCLCLVWNPMYVNNCWSFAHCEIPHLRTFIITYKRGRSLKIRKYGSFLYCYNGCFTIRSHSSRHVTTSSEGRAFSFG